ncbi:MAG: MBL fold metallo-hydrolase [Candidatus Heimdallarchaeota archaeon]|nr:MBL fold metallo-hydrolase [Candidatus Heimdallarchaeota archaeon]
MAKFETIKLGITNIFLIEIGEGYLLIDTSIKNKYRTFQRKLKKMNISPSEINYLLLTHHHSDHVGFANRLLAETNAKLIVHQEEVPLLEQGKNQTEGVKGVNGLLRFVWNIAKKIAPGFPPVSSREKDIVIEQEEYDLQEIGLDGKVLHTPGHTPGHISVILADGTVFTGDVIMNFLQFLGLQKRPLILYDQNEVMRSWDKILQYGAKTIRPAHGQPFKAEKLTKYIKKFEQQIKEKEEESK